MKNIIIISAIALICCMSCKSRNENDHGHQHDDGTTHGDHATETQQEEFNVDSSGIKIIIKDDHDHSHENEQPHKHE